MTYVIFTLFSPITTPRYLTNCVWSGAWASIHLWKCTPAQASLELISVIDSLTDKNWRLCNYKGVSRKHVFEETKWRNPLCKYLEVGGKGVHKPFPCLPFLSPSGDLVVELVRDIHPIRPSATFKFEYSNLTCSKPFNTDLKRPDHSSAPKVPQIAPKLLKIAPRVPQKRPKSAPKCQH